MLQRLSDCGGEHRAGADFHRSVEPRQEHEHAGKVHGADFNHAPAAEVQHGVPEKEEKGQNEEERVEECRRKGGHGKGKQALSRLFEPAEQEADQKPHEQARDDAQERGPPRTDAEAEHTEGAHAEALDEAGDTENQADDRRCAGSHRGCGYGNRNGQEGNFDDPCMKVSERGERQKQLDCGKHGNLNELQRSFFLSVDHDKILISGIPFPEFLYYLYIVTYSSAFVKWKVVNSWRTYGGYLCYLRIIKSSFADICENGVTKESVLADFALIRHWRATFPTQGEGLFRLCKSYLFYFLILPVNRRCLCILRKARGSLPPGWGRWHASAG